MKTLVRVLKRKRRERPLWWKNKEVEEEERKKKPHGNETPLLSPSLWKISLLLLRNLIQKKEMKHSISLSSQEESVEKKGQALEGKKEGRN